MTTTEAPATSAGPSSNRRAVWGRRLVIVVLLAGAGWFLVWGSQRAETGVPSTGENAVVLNRFPGPDAMALRQTEVGADLAPGFDGRLTINGIAIPEDEMQGALDAEARAETGYTGDEVRPNNRNHVFFLPGEDKVIEKLPQGEVTITVTYFRDQRPDTDRGSSTWTITVN